MSMKTDLFYCTGTGNSLWTARMVARELRDARISPISGEPIESEADAIGLIFPVHMWGLPHRVIAALDALPKDRPAYYFAVAVNAGQVAATLLQLKKLMHSKGLSLSAGFENTMPSNYVPWGGPGPEEKRKERIDKARKKIVQIAAAVLGREERPVDRGPLWLNFLFGGLYRLAFPHVPAMDKSLWFD
jgi:hypothetical protein